MVCKCGANALEKHRENVADGRYTGHVYTGHFWRPLNDPWFEQEPEEEVS